MQKYIYKYYRQYTYLFLSAYLFLIALTIFHYHKYNFQEGNYDFELNTKENASPIDNLADVNSECTVSHFSNTISNSSYAPVVIPERNNDKTYFVLENKNELPYQILYKHNPLRAPPSILFS
jgi:hypothetical protein